MSDDNKLDKLIGCQEMDALYKALHPLSGNALTRETGADYQDRVAPLLPHFPAEVLQDWLYHHHIEVIGRYGWLGFQRLRFEKQEWTTKRIVRDVQAQEPSWIDSWRLGLLTEKRFYDSKLGRYTIEQGTWPIPPLVLDNVDCRIKHPRGQTVHPWHLIEGHHRLGYLHALCENEVWTARPEHEIWVVKRV